MVTDPRQEQMMQLAQAIRQMGMPNPNSRTTDILTQGRVMGGTAMNPYAGTQTGRAPTNLLDIIAMAEAGGQTQKGVEGRYLDFARQQKGWNPAWDDYLPQLLRMLQNPGADVTEGYVMPTQPGVYGGGRQPGIPPEIWGQMAEFGKTIPDIKSREWQGPVTPPPRPPSGPGGTPWPGPPIDERSQGPGNAPTRRASNGGMERLDMTTGRWEPFIEPQIQGPGRGIVENIQGPGNGGQSPSVLSDLARKNAMRRQVLARLMGRPTGASSLMELMGQQQPY